MAEVIVVDNEDQQREIIITILKDEGIKAKGASTQKRQWNLLTEYGDASIEEKKEGTPFLLNIS